MPLAIGRMLWAAFREGMGQEICARARKNASKSIRSQDIRVERIIRNFSFSKMNESAVRLRTKVAVDEPFLIPNRFERPCCRFGDERLNV